MSLIKRILILCLLLAMQRIQSTVHNARQPQHSLPVIMLDPAGDAEHPGRPLEQHFERGLTLQCVNYIQPALEQHLPNARIIVTRTAGDKVAPLHHANFANRLDNVLLYLHCAFYKEQGSRPVLRLYRFSYQQHPPSRPATTLFLRYDHAYEQNEKNSATSCNTLYQWLTQYATTHNFFDIYPPCAFPHAALCGITCPALVIEIGLPHDAMWQQSADLIVQALAMMFTERS